MRKAVEFFRNLSANRLIPRLRRVFDAALLGMTTYERRMLAALLFLALVLGTVDFFLQRSREVHLTVVHAVENPVK